MRDSELLKTVVKVGGAGLGVGAVIGGGLYGAVSLGLSYGQSLREANINAFLAAGDEVIDQKDERGGSTFWRIKCVAPGLANAVQLTLDSKTGALVEDGKSLYLKEPVRAARCNTPTVADAPTPRG